MAKTLTRGPPHRITDFATTVTLVTWDGGDPDFVTIRATTQAVYVSFGAAEGAAVPANYWLIPAGECDVIDFRAAGPDFGLAVAAVSDVHVWGR